MRAFLGLFYFMTLFTASSAWSQVGGHVYVLPVVKASGYYSKLQKGMCIVHIEKRDDETALVTIAVAERLSANLNHFDLNSLPVSRSEIVNLVPFQSELAWSEQKILQYGGRQKIVEKIFALNSIFAIMDIDNNQTSYAISTDLKLDSVSGVVIQRNNFFIIDPGSGDRSPSYFNPVKVLQHITSSFRESDNKAGEIICNNVTS